MNRSSGFSLGGSYAPHRQLQHQTGGLGSGSVSASELQHLQASMTDSFSSSHVPSPSYQSQASTHDKMHVRRCNSHFLFLVVKENGGFSFATLKDHVSSSYTFCIDITNCCCEASMINMLKSDPPT